MGRELDGWNFATVWEHHASRFPDAPALVHGDLRRSWGELDARATGLATFFLDRGLGRGSKVVQYLYDCAEYLESVHAAMKVSAVPVNTNFRYNDDELAYLWDNADAEAVVFDLRFADRVERVRQRVPGVRVWLAAGAGDAPPWASAYEAAVASRADPDAFPERSGDDVIMLYTGGTTGMPKGVLWRQDDLFVQLDAIARMRLPDRPDLGHLATGVVDPGSAVVVGARLMHGTGLFYALASLDRGGAVVTLEGASFDPAVLLDAVDAERVWGLAIVGDAFARPILRALDAEPRRWDLSALRQIFSGGVMWSREVKEGLLRHAPHVALVDALGSSEAAGLGSSVTTGDRPPRTATFQLGRNARVLDDQLRDVVRGSGQRGRIAVAGRVPIGYYKDEAKTRATFPVVDGVRYSMPGDWATVEEDGTIKLLGRGSVCINSGGEKVFPEEVEEVLKTCPGVGDALVVGIPDERFGEIVVAMVEPEPGVTLAEAAVIGHAKAKLAGYKAPKHVLVAPSVQRSPNGKADYAQVRRQVAEWLLADAAAPDR